MIGIKEPEFVEDDDKALQMFSDSVEFKDQRYFVSWPWKDDCAILPSNFVQALSRLRAVVNRLKQNPKLFKQYQDIITQQLNNNIIERVDDDNTKRRTTMVHYLPHHAVMTPSKTTTKIRIVYDGSAKPKSTDKSLNDCLLQGPTLLEDLCAILLRFRLNEIGVTADIEKAFLQIGLKENDRDVTRFLWLRNPNLMTIDDNIQILRFARVPFGIVSSPFLLMATIRHHLENKGDMAEKIMENIYVDNIVTGFSNTDQAIEFYNESKSMFNEMSMNLREWSSNDISFVEKLPACDRQQETIVKVLGITWNTSSDELTMKVPNVFSYSQITKRTVLSYTAMIFDPFGLFCPTILLLKLFLRKLTVGGYNWDDKLPDDVENEFKQLLLEVAPLSNFSINRHIRLSTIVELHCFCDASQNAYGICVYLRCHINTVDCQAKPTLIFAKARVAPLKERSIPQLELIAIQCGRKALEFVEKSLHCDISRKVLWTDSQCALWWLSSNKTLSTFVRNRVAEIKKLPNVEYRYVCSQDNPADIASRGKIANDLHESTLWWNGPQWLCLDDSNWPISNITANECTTEVESLLVHVKENMKSPFNIDESHYSSLNRLLRVTAWMSRFLNNLRKQTSHNGA